MKETNKIKLNVNKSKRRRETVFALAIVILPLLWWAFSFSYTTIDSIVLAFVNLDGVTGIRTPVGFANIAEVFRLMFTPGELLNYSISNSVLLWLVNTCVAMPISLIVSFALYKKAIGTGVFKIILFLPSIISSMVWVVVFTSIIEKGLGLDWISNNDVNFLTLLFYNLWIGFAGNMVLYTGAMGRVPPSLVEAGHLDGMSDFQEFIYIVLPLIFPTLSVILTTCIISIFTVQLPAFTFYGFKSVASGEYNHLFTFGLYNFMKGQTVGENQAVLPIVSALSVVVCLIAAPVSLAFRKLLEKISPTVEF